MIPVTIAPNFWWFVDPRRAVWLTPHGELIVPRGHWFHWTLGHPVFCEALN